MSESAESVLKILIEMKSIGLADVEAAKQLVVEMGQAGKDLDKSMGVVRVSQEEVNKIIGKGGEKAEMSHMAMKRLANTLGSDIPGGAALMEAGFMGAAEPMMGATFLLIAGIEQLREAIKKIHEQEESGRAAAEGAMDIAADRTKAAEKTKDALEQAEVAEALFHHNYIHNAEDAIAKASALAQAILKSTIAASESGDIARKSVAAKEIEDMEQRGVVSHATALKMKEQLDIQYEQQKLTRMMAQNALEREVLVNQYQNKILQSGYDAKAEKAAEGKYESAVGAKTANDTKAEEAQAKIDQATEHQKSLRAKGVDAESMAKLADDYAKEFSDDSKAKRPEEMLQLLAKRRLLTGFKTTLSQSTFDLVKHADGQDLVGAYQMDDTSIKAGQFDLAQARKRRPRLDIAEGNAKSDLEAARRAMEKSRDEVRAFQDKITETDATNTIKEGGGKQDLGIIKANSELVADRGIADRVQAGGNVSGVDQQKLIADASRIAGHQVDLKTAAKIIENGAGDLGIFMKQVSSLAKVMAGITPNQADLQRQINEIRRHMSSRPV